MMACHKQTLCIVALILSLAMPHAMAADCAPGEHNTYRLGFS